MHIASDSIHNDARPLAESTFLSKSIRGIGALLQRVYNAPQWREPACVASFACGGLISIAASAGTKLISYAVEDINDLLAPCECVSPQAYREVMCAGLKYGLSGGILTGLAVATTVRHCFDFSNAGEEYGLVKRHLLSMGAAMGLSFGGLAGMLYAIHLQQVHNTGDNYLFCYDHPPVIINERHFNM